MIKVCNRIIEYSFYGLFLLVPLAFTSKTSELFELNKMWLTWGLTIIIGTAWLTKIILQRRIIFQRTPLDIPIALFLLSQIISTIFSQDIHVSLWGYYSRFNGGLLSIVSYIFLYYAFLSNFARGDTTGRAPDSAHLSKAEGALAGGKVGAGPRANETGPAIKMVKRLLSLSLISGLIVALWGLPSHFGYDPTCFLFRGTLDVSCWTADFIPTIRIFSTLGQPDWLAAYLAILIPITIALILIISHNHRRSSTHLIYLAPLILLILFYIDLLFTRARSGVLGVWISLIFFFAAVYFWFYGKPKFSIFNSQFSILIGIFLLITFIIGTPINQLRSFTLEGIGSFFQKVQVQRAPPPPTQPHEPGGTESGDIRLNVWKGAMNAWRANPLFGTGVETFAFAYYKYKPAGQNLTSEWNFLYNKAHNEYLNYLATTGVFGLGSYLLMIGYFLFLSLKQFKIQNSKGKTTRLAEALAKRAIQNSKLEKYTDPNYTLDAKRYTLILALLASYISILVTNFFGFSVVITNIYLFMVPAFVFILGGMINYKKNESKIANYAISIWQWTAISFLLPASYFLLITLFRFWQADIAYALGYNLDRAGEYQKAYQNLRKAVELRGDELVFKDELSVNNAIIAASLAYQKEQNQSTKDQTISVATNLIQEAINTSNEIISKSPNNAVFWKTRTRVFYTLSQINSRYLPRAVNSIEKAASLAPNDANITYNLGVLYGQNNNIKKGIEALEKTVKLKPDYRDARYALGLYYHTAALNEKAIAQMQYILDHIAPQDPGAQEAAKNWGK